MNDAHFPLTPLQHAMVAAWQRAPRAGVDVEQWVVTLRENVDVAALRRAWSQTVAAYGALRTELDLRDPVNPRQKVCPQVADDFSVQRLPIRSSPAGRLFSKPIVARGSTCCGRRCGACK